MDITSKRFGRLTVVEKVSKEELTDKRPGSYWLCECDCGNRRVVPRHRLMTGKTKSCGCLAAEYTSLYKTKDLTGQRFGRLLVMERVKVDDKKGHDAHWKCLCDCGNECVVNGHVLRNGGTKSCGCYRKEYLRSQRGEKNCQWRGGRFETKGYVKVYAPDHPNATGRYVLEHVKVMSEQLGRPLLPEETVHHKNGVKNDNRPENLELWSSNHPKGQRVEDLVEHAIRILQLYAPNQLIAAIPGFPEARRNE